VRSIVVSHGVEVWQPMAAGRRRALRNANLVIAPSRYTVRKLVEIQGLVPGTIRRLAWPIDPVFLRLAETPEKLPIPLGFPEGRVVLTVGRWATAERYKGADQLISALAALSGTHTDLHLAIIGSGDDVPRLQSLAEGTRAANRIHFFEGLSREEIAGSYARADVFALPSTGEGFGLVFLEAMALAKPVIGVAAGGVPDLIEDGLNGLLLPEQDSTKLAEAIDRLLRDDSLRWEMGRHGAERIRREFQFGTFCSLIEKVLQEMISH
jgi:phosphatidyl-myo-inositol dimannoside synthase